MRIKKVRELITDAVLAERERCAKVAERHGSRTVRDEILSARPPEIRVIRPETAAKKPELVTPHTIIAGASAEGLG